MKIIPNVTLAKMLVHLADGKPFINGIVTTVSPTELEFRIDKTFLISTPIDETTGLTVGQPISIKVSDMSVDYVPIATELPLSAVEQHSAARGCSKSDMANYNHRETYQNK